jgi:hypothetical protein
MPVLVVVLLLIGAGWQGARDGSADGYRQPTAPMLIKQLHRDFYDADADHRVADHVDMCDTAADIRAPGS